MIVAFTGHRPDKLGGYAPCAMHTWVRDRIRAKLELLKPTKAISGMALGVDQWAAWSCVFLKIPFVAAIPFSGQEKRWPSFTQQEYRNLLAHAEKVIMVCPRYHDNAFQQRNEWMVDQLQQPGDILLAVWDGSSGGTANCVAYAQEQKKEIIRINPREFPR